MELRTLMEGREGERKERERDTGPKKGGLEGGPREVCTVATSLAGFDYKPY